MPSDCTIVILTFNSAGVVNETIRQASKVTANIVVVDSYSTDVTVAIASDAGCRVVQREFVHYADQRNWAIDQFGSESTWQLHLDADEVLDEEAVRSITQVVAGKSGADSFDAYLIRRLDYFMGKRLRHSGLNPWHLRLFRAGAARCEDRRYDQHFITNASVGRLGGAMHDLNVSTLREWVDRHNRWSELEAEELLSGAAAGDILQGRFFGDPRERTRWLKQRYYRAPGGLRAVAYFLYRYVIKGGFLDGRVGFYFAFFQALWFRLLVDAKVYERELLSH
jgi:glycosyltransferase involved in cell wall biosynthesis